MSFRTNTTCAFCTCIAALHCAPVDLPLGDGASGAGGSTTNGSSGGVSALAGKPASAAGNSGSGGQPAPDGSQGGAAGEPGVIVEGRYGFVVLPVLPPAEPPEQVGDDDLLLGGTTATVVSRDGSRVFGTSRYGYHSSVGTVVAAGKTSFSWTAEQGTQPLDLPPSWRGCASDDGSVLMGFETDAVDDFQNFFRWEASTGRQLASPMSYSWWTDPREHWLSCSGDLDVFVANAYYGEGDEPQSHALAWLQSSSSGLMFEPRPSSAPVVKSSAHVTRDGSAIVLSVHEDESDQTAVYRWTSAGGYELLEPPADSWCAIHTVSEDGSSLLGFCPDGYARWQHGDTEVTQLAGVGTFVRGVSPSTRVVIGTPAIGFVSSWDGTKRLPDIEADTFRMLGFAGDEAAFGTREDNQGRQQALRWDPDVGFSVLPPLPGDRETHVLGYSDDGSLAVGYSFDTEGGSGYRAVLWDEQGARDIATELAAAGIDIDATQTVEPFDTRFQLTEANGVWKGSTIRVRGRSQAGVASHIYEQTWFADLPAR